MEGHVWKKLEHELDVNALLTSLILTVAHSLNLVKFLSTTTMEIALQCAQMDTMEITQPSFAPHVSFILSEQSNFSMSPVMQ